MTYTQALFARALPSGKLDIYNATSRLPRATLHITSNFLVTPLFMLPHYFFSLVRDMTYANQTIRE